MDHCKWYHFIVVSERKHLIELIIHLKLREWHTHIHLPETLSPMWQSRGSYLLHLCRDDCLKMWEITQDFVSDIVTIFYEDDEEVEKDEELSNMLADLRRNGFHRRADIQETFTSIEALVRFLTIVIFR